MKKILMIVMCFVVCTLFIDFSNSESEIVPIVENYLVYEESLGLGNYEDNDVDAVVRFELNYDLYIPIAKSMYTEQNVDDLIKENRELGKEYYSTRNNEIVSKLNMESLGSLYVSHYSSFVIYDTNKLDVDEITEEIRQYLTSPYISNVYIYYEGKVVEEIDTSWEELGFDTYSSYTGYGIYDGTGVNVGILEDGDCDGTDGGIIDENHVNFTNTDFVIRNESYCDETSDIHANRVASIAVSDYGIARGATLLSVLYHGPDVTSEIEWLLDNDVNVINMSWGSASDGGYTSKEKYLDYIIDTYSVTMVKSAGNAGNADTFVTSPGMAYNIITVGSLLEDVDDRNPESSWEESISNSKPNVMAPGTLIKVNTIGSGSGTSYAAPHVTGIIALMMEKRPFLKSHPELVGAILQANATFEFLNSGYNDFDMNGFEDEVGAGMVKADYIMDNILKASYVNVQNKDSGDIVYEKTIFLNQNAALYVSTFNIREITKVFELYIPAFIVVDYDIKLYNNSGVLVDSVTGNYDNKNLLVYHTGSYGAGYYTIKIELKDNNISQDDLAVAYRYTLGSC